MTEPVQPIEQLFKGYELLEPLDQPGGTTRTFKAKDKRLERVVALRYGTPDPGAESPAETFFGSAAGIARVRHEKLARGLDAGRAGQYFFMAWEFVRGESLADRLARLGRSRIAEAETVRLLAGATEALTALYAVGLAHRSLTPASLRCHPDGGMRLTGMGWAHECFFASPEAAALARADYAAPEQFEGVMLDDIRADLYALGCLWYRALFGTAPFHADTPEAVRERHLNDTPVAPQELDPRIAKETAKLIAWLLEKDRDQRPRSPKELLTAIKKHPLYAPPEPKIVPGSFLDDDPVLAAKCRPAAVAEADPDADEDEDEDAGEEHPAPQSLSTPSADASAEPPVA